MQARVQLFQDGGVSGPVSRIPYESIDDAVAWAGGQVGHPWDGMLVNVFQDDDPREQATETHELRYDDGSWGPI